MLLDAQWSPEWKPEDWSKAGDSAPSTPGGRSRDESADSNEGDQSRENSPKPTERLVSVRKPSDLTLDGGKADDAPSPGLPRALSGNLKIAVPHDDHEQPHTPDIQLATRGEQKSIGSAKQPGSASPKNRSASSGSPQQPSSGKLVRRPQSNADVLLAKPSTPTQQQQQHGTPTLLPQAALQAGTTGKNPQGAAPPVPGRSSGDHSDDRLRTSSAAPLAASGTDSKSSELKPPLHSGAATAVTADAKSNTAAPAAANTGTAATLPPAEKSLVAVTQDNKAEAKADSQAVAKPADPVGATAAVVPAQSQQVAAASELSPAASTEAANVSTSSGSVTDGSGVWD